MKAHNILPDEYPKYFGQYIEKAGAEELITGLEYSMKQCVDFWESIPQDKLEYQYEEGKWTVKDIIQHHIDVERIFCNRALRYARKDETPLPSFDEDDFALQHEANRRTLEELVNEYKAVRLATIALFKSFNDEMLIRSGNGMSVRSMAFIIVGHETHHNNVIKDRYL